MPADRPTRIGVLALQGSFAEHVTMLKRIDGVQAFEVRTKAELQSADGLIIPGGESTTMALVAERWGLIPELRQFSAQHRPVWGTCAGAIFLAEKATGRLYRPAVLKAVQGLIQKCYAVCSPFHLLNCIHANRHKGRWAGSCRWP